jgi:hypothetical protein
VNPALAFTMPMPDLPDGPVRSDLEHAVYLRAAWHLDRAAAALSVTASAA